MGDFGLLEVARLHVREHFIEFDQEGGGELGDVVGHELQFSGGHGDLFLTWVERFVSTDHGIDLC